MSGVMFPRRSAVPVIQAPPSFLHLPPGALMRWEVRSTLANGRCLCIDNALICQPDESLARQWWQHLNRKYGRTIVSIKPATTQLHHSFLVELHAQGFPVQL